MTLPKELIPLFALVAASSLSLASDKAPGWVTEGPYVVEKAFSFELPLEVLANKLFVEVEVGGAPRRFVFDTGSPSMMSAKLAKELGLKVIDKRKGRDSHGAIVESEIVQADLNVGGTVFHKTPLFVADFPKTAQCLFDGVLGSEVLPLCAWQIDLSSSVLRCHSELSKLDHLDKAKKQTLYDFGYPHAPIFDIQFADKAKSKAMFDTGSPEYLAVSPPDFEGAKHNGGVGDSLSGSGSLGASLGGVAPNKEQLQMQLKTLSIGNVEMGKVGALLRESPPSLIGASVLEHFIVTLDSRSSSAYFLPYRDGPFSRSTYGFSLNFEESPTVSLIWDDSPAKAAGLRVGHRIASINGEPATTSCEGIRSAMRAMSEGDVIELTWEGGAAKLNRERTLTD
ncbi:protein containing PDZ domain [Hahella chejuensis KCTC 2396]|uniref:Protein containing PDZ domain n=1 Tax=Hahella chejuensis (strain KCTC 2396) TaxID=349521 RepID=Q2SPP7_HAHCH|nr:aspartyl protease family protein [Hahella chejuensis]ABC27377.1 protein containing PDZ domain [Hahella chejuensis KCTC 2396]